MAKTIARLLSPQNAPAQSIGASPLLPFLYFTETILRRHQSTRGKISYRDSARLREDKDGAPDQRVPAKRSSFRKRPPSSPHQSELPARSFETRSASKDHQSPGQRFSTGSTRQSLPSIPFERSQAQQDPYDALQLGDSTITPNERRAFESLFNLRLKPQSHDGNALTSRTEADHSFDATNRPTALGQERELELPAVLQTLWRNIKAQKAVHEPEAIGISSLTASHESEDAALDAAVSQSRHQLSKTIDGAATDIDAWNMFRTQVLDRVVSLQVRPADKPLSSDTILTHGQQEGTLSTSNPVCVSEAATLQKSLPELLITVLNRLASSFPASSLPLSVLPTLKALGASTFRLGISIKLYNLHMRLLFERYSDPHGIVEVLKEMDSEIHAGNNETLELLDDILIFAHQVEQGEHGIGMRSLWKLERAQASLVQIAAWRRDLLRKLEENALQTARQQGNDEMATVSAHGS